MRVWLLALAVFVIGTSGVVCLKLESVEIPPTAKKDSYLKVQCKYKLDLGDTLYSVKWYKDGNEFFRYVPRDHPPGRAFEVLGVDIDEENCTETTVTFGPLTFISSGRYRCEVSGEAPLFETVSQHRDMIVVYIPKEDPTIIGGRPRYHINDVVRLNCTSGRSRPAAALIWQVNGEQVDESLLKGLTEEEGDDGLYVTNLGLEFRVQPKHFKNGDMKLKCIATIASIYNGAREESVEGEKPLRAPALESRDSAVAGDSRADRVQAGSNPTASINQMLIMTPLIYSISIVINTFIR